MGDDSLHCEEGKENEFDMHAGAIIYNHWTELVYKVLKISNHHIRVVVTRRGVNRGIGLGLETPVDYFFHRGNPVIKWIKKSMEKLAKCTNVKVKKCMI